MVGGTKDGEEGADVTEEGPSGLMRGATGVYEEVD